MADFSNSSPGDRPKGNRSGLAIVGVVGCAILLVCGGVMLLFGLGVMQGIKDAKIPTPASYRTACFTADDLSTFLPGFTPNPAYESLGSSRLFGELEIECEYETPDGHPEVMYISSTVTIAKTNSDARTNYATSEAGVGLGIAISGTGVVLQDANHLLSWGDKSSMKLMVGDEGPGGHTFVARKGKRTYLMVVGGVYFEDAETASDAMLPWLERAHAFQP